MTKPQFHPKAKNIRVNSESWITSTPVLENPFRFQKPSRYKKWNQTALNKAEQGNEKGWTLLDCRRTRIPLWRSERHGCIIFPVSPSTDKDSQLHAGLQSMGVTQSRLSDWGCRHWLMMPNTFVYAYLISLCLLWWRECLNLSPILNWVVCLIMEGLFFFWHHTHRMWGLRLGGRLWGGGGSPPWRDTFQV